ncbi:hypothetical protein INR49_021918 [Caranx melampygus]|nr:hypothetical protein INR49_021918 [Caranx melampygus]
MLLPSGALLLLAALYSTVDLTGAEFSRLIMVFQHGVNPREDEHNSNARKRPSSLEKEWLNPTSCGTVHSTFTEELKPSELGSRSHDLSWLCLRENKRLNIPSQARNVRAAQSSDTNLI